MGRATAAQIDDITDLDPRRAAEWLVRARGEGSEWLDAFAEHLDRQRNAQALSRVLSVWNLNQSQAAELFGVSRQAISKWLVHGVPSERAEAVADLEAATDLLVHYLKRDRIPAVVRRSAPALGDLSLLELMKRRGSRAVLEACRQMFDFGQP